MKNLFPIYLIFLSITIIIVISTFADASTYVSFSDAKSLYSVGKKSPIHVVGRLIKNEENQVIGIKKSDDNLSFSFEMIDEEGTIENVFYGEPMPPDFILSDQVVVIGSYNDKRFIAKEILLKCPSKYTEDQVNI
ncbi:MAG: cytochrome C biogenesis protein [Cytophagia bacterium]|nr:cytochrome C biogenesis protein [Cytophagia bacterium]|tara:strand:- start:568 stop:972 length:405 start_codon:yes stop_codon:yes gene_type:complete